MLEANWRGATSNRERRGVCEAVFIFIGVFCYVLLGPSRCRWLGVARQVWEYCRQHPIDHSMLALVDRSKRLIHERAFLVLPCVYMTKSGQAPGKWMERIIARVDVKVVHEL